MTATVKIGERAFRKAFGQGLAAVAALYLLIFGWTALQADKTLKRLEEQFPYRAVLLDHGPEGYIYPPAPVLTPEPEIEHHEPVAAAEAEVEVVVPTGPLKPAPIEGLYETTADGKIPKISAEGLTPFEAYKRPFANQGNPTIVLAVRDYGLSAADSDLALALPPEVTLILSPYSDDPELWQRKAREAGHEVWLLLPMENTRFLQEDPGPEALLSHSSLPENKAKLERVLARATGYAGVVAETDKAFLDMHAMLGELIKFVFSSGLAYVEVNPTGSEFLETLAVAGGAPFASINENGIIYKQGDLDRVESMARQKNMYIVSVALLPKNMDNIRNWTSTLTAKGLTLAPLSAAAAGKVAKKDAPAPAEAPAAAHHP